MKIFLTGGGGFIGKNFIKELLKLGYFIFATTRKKRKNKKNLKWLYGDLDKGWIRELKKSDVLVHMAAAGVNNKSIHIKDAIKSNVVKPYMLLHDAIKAKCLKWIIIGTASEYGAEALKKKKLGIKSDTKPQTSYEISKLLFTELSKNLSKKYNVQCRIMRLFTVYGKGENKKRLWSALTLAARLKRNFYMTDGTQIKDFISVNEVVNILVDSLNFKKNNKLFPQVWHIATGKSQTVKKFANNLWDKHGGKGKIIFGKLNKNDFSNYISDSKSIWKM
jgi:nucleoside-diphosphate-sugar epimerase